MLSRGMAKSLRGLVGFEIVRVRVHLRRPVMQSHRKKNDRRNRCKRRINERLGSALGKAKWSRKETVMFGDHDIITEVLTAKFRPLDSTS